MTPEVCRSKTRFANESSREGAVLASRTMSETPTPPSGIPKTITLPPKLRAGVAYALHKERWRLAVHFRDEFLSSFTEPALQPLHSAMSDMVTAAEQLAIINLIGILEEAIVSLPRFRGHLPKGGYDVRDGIKQGYSTRTPAVH